MRLSKHLLAATFLSMAACGGGGGGGGGAGAGGGGGGGLNNTLFTGSYFTAVFGGNTSIGAPYASMLAGPLVAAGNGSGTWNLTLNNTDGVLGALPILPMTNLVSGDGSFTLSTGGLNLTGGIPAAGDVIALAGVAPGSDPTMCLGLKSTGAFNAASLSGQYHLAYLDILGNTGANQSAQSRVVFDGVSTWAFAGATTFNNNGVVAAPVPPGPGGPYAVSATGSVTLSGPPGNFTGAVLAGGNLVLLAGDTAFGQRAKQVLLIRVGAGLNAATFFGNYWVAGLKMEDPTFSVITSFTGTINANGAGTLNFVATTENAEGAVGPNAGVTDFVVFPDGTLATENVGGPLRVGAISPDGRFAFLSGEVVAGGPPIQFFFVKK